MQIRTELLGAFLSVTVLALSVYGVAVYRIAPDIAHDTSLQMLEHWTAELAGHVAGNPDGAGITKTHLMDYLRERQLPPDVIAVLNDGAGPPIMVDRLGDKPGLRGVDIMPVRPDEMRSGAARIGDEDYLWLSRRIEGTAYVLTLAEPQADHTAQVAHIISTRLISSALIVVWFAIWVALVLASIIARRLDEKNATLLYQARHDSLTGLPNRTSIYSRLHDLIKQDKPSRFALLVMDLNGFKEVNDTLGHHFGDQILLQIGRRMTAAFRDNDIVARLGGDEFAVLVPGADVSRGVACAKRILSCFDAPFSIEEVTLVVRPSIGIAYYPDHGEDADTLIRCADVAMYNAKRGMYGYESYQANVDTHNVRRLRLMSDLHAAIEAGQFELYYQPKIEMASRRITGVEALLRWKHAAYGFVPPDEFIPLAEQSGMMPPLTDWVLNQALQQCAQWRSEGLDISVAVNISAHSLNNPDFPRQLDGLLHQWRLPARFIELEITESAMMRNLDLAETILSRLGCMGVKLAIDDFGTGFSSLAYLQRLPVNTLKIDKSFVIGMARGENNDMIVRSTIDLGRNMGLEVVAEGVEDGACFDALLQMGCTTAQGYHIARPMPARNFAQWLAESPWGIRRSVVALHHNDLRIVSN